MNENMEMLQAFAVHGSPFAGKHYKALSMTERQPKLFTACFCVLCVSVVKFPLGPQRFTGFREIEKGTGQISGVNSVFCFLTSVLAVRIEFEFEFEGNQVLYREKHERGTGQISKVFERGTKEGRVKSRRFFTSPESLD
jgi:hypothetical protein